MQRHHVAWGLWIAGTALIVGSWTDVVSPTLGWIGFVIAFVGAVLPRDSSRDHPSRYPLTQEGFPVQPSGTPIPPDVTLESGMPVLAYSQGRWWRAVVVAADERGEVVVTFPGWDAEWMEQVPRTSLQIDPDPNRRPIEVPPDLLARWRTGGDTPGVKPADPNGLQDGW